MSKGQIFRRVMIGVTIGLMIGTFIMSIVDVNGVSMMAWLTFIFGLISTTPEHEIDQMFCEHDWEEYDQMGLVSYKCTKCGKVRKH